MITFLSKYIQKLPIKYPGVFVAAALVSGAFIYVAIWSLHRVGLDISLSVEWVLAPAFGYLIEHNHQTSMNAADSAANSLKMLDGHIATFNTTIADNLPILGPISSILLKNYSEALQTYLSGGRFLTEQVNGLFSKWQTRIEKNQNWRAIFGRHIETEEDAVERNNFSMPLSVYLRIILDAIVIGLAEAHQKGKSLVVVSFTNASPRDWFTNGDGPVVGQNMETYSKQLRDLALKMRSGRHKYRRYVIASDKLSRNGIHNKKDIEKHWRELPPEDRGKYFSLHTSNGDAKYLELSPEISFSGNLTELIFFGFEDAKSINWEWCYCCGYTSNNLGSSLIAL